jgi:hypothetical protein
MTVPFDTLPDDARVWIYPAHRSFSESEIVAIQDALTQFLSQWTAHNQTLEAAFDLPYNRFIVIGVNQQSVHASGCSIDASVRFIQDLEKQFDLVLLDKMNVTFRQGAYLAYKPLDEFVKMAKAHSVSKETIVFNNLVDNVGDYKTFWEIPAGESWHSRFIK